MNLKTRIAKLEDLKRTVFDEVGNDLRAEKCLCEAMLKFTIEDKDSDERTALLRQIWEIENGYMEKWLQAEDEARPKRWKDMNMDERAEENVERVRRRYNGNSEDFMYIKVDHPEIPEADLDELRKRYNCERM